MKKFVKKEYLIDGEKKTLLVEEKEENKENLYLLDPGEIFYPIFKKPPLGVKPKKFVEEERALELSRAIFEYLKNGLKPKFEWVDELWELTGAFEEE